MDARGANQRTPTLRCRFQSNAEPRIKCFQSFATCSYTNAEKGLTRDATRVAVPDGPIPVAAAQFLPLALGGRIVPFSIGAGVVQWQNRSFPSFGRGFDSHRPLQSPMQGRTLVIGFYGLEAHWVWRRTFAEPPSLETCDPAWLRSV